MAGRRVLLIEDDESLAHVIRLELEHAQWDVTVRADGRSGLAAALASGWDIVLLDLMLPQLSGMDVCRSVRAAGMGIPIIMLTARHETRDKVSGLDIGADDYVTKPFSTDELMARMRAALRRRGHAEGDETLAVGDVRIDTAQHRVAQGDELVRLTKREFDLLYCLLSNANRVLSRDKLLEQVWGFDFEGDTGVVDVYVRYLRAKLERPGHPRIIHTVRGVGFVAREGAQ